MLFFDIETDGLKPTVIYMAVFKDGESIIRFNDAEPLQEYIKGKTICGHNIIGYDIPVLEKLWGIDFSTCTLVDTLVLSRLDNPQRDGGHSLKSWGERLNFHKGNHTDWSEDSDEMFEYCVRDVNLTERVYLELKSEIDPEASILEHSVAQIIHQQVENGWLLDQNKCHDLLAELKEKKFELEDEVHKRFIPLPTFVKVVKPKTKKDGTMSIVGLKFLGDEWTTVGGDFSRIDFPEFNLGSRQQIARYLEYFGWKPEKFTEKGSPIVDESVLINVEIPEAKLIAEYLLVTKRTAQVNSWLDAVGEDGRVHGDVNPIGAVTGRMTHSSPNVAQVPASYSPYGHQCRSCWTVPEGKALVGADASGLELRMLAHYMNDEAYTNEILNGDIHSANQKAAGLDTRDQAKTFIYAFLYGAGDAKIGSVVGGSAQDGQRLKQRFLRATPALENLRNKVEQAAARGFLRGLDGRKLWIRSSHAALNTLLQSAGAVVMKKALVMFVDYSKQWKLETKLIGNIHDEIQMEVSKNQADKAGYLLVECIKAAGVELGLNCPLDGDYKVGIDWSQTH